MSFGVVYVATGSKYIKEAKTSIESLHKHMSNISVTVFSDRKFECEGVDNLVQLENPRYDYGDSIVDLEKVPYERTLFLDTDTIVCDDISELFQSLDRFDFAATHTPGKRYYTAEEVPESFPLYNSGVFLFKKNSRTKELFELWRQFYLQTVKQNREKYNQPSLRKALYFSNVNILTLPREYNTFILRPGQLCDKVKIIHGRHPDLNKIRKDINETQEPRCYIPYHTDYPISLLYPGNINGYKPSYTYRMKSKLSNVKLRLNKKGIRTFIDQLISKAWRD